MDKSAEMIIAILGIHKAGAGYVPLGLEQPTSRLSMILKQSNCRMVLINPGSKKSSERILEEFDVVPLTVNLENLEPSPKLDITLTCDDVSHVLFTSGS